MWVTDIFLIIIFLLVLRLFLLAEPFTATWGGIGTLWHKNMATPYSTQIGDKLVIFNPTAYNR